MSYTHISTFERGRIQELFNLGLSHNEIAKQICRHRSTIDTEIYRNSVNGRYIAETSHLRYLSRRKNCHCKGKYTEEIANLIADRIQATWSPEQIANTVAKHNVVTKTIYNWLYKGLLPDITEINLRHNGKRRHKDKRGIFSMGTSIKKRPKEVKERNTFGHWELNTLVSSRGNAKGCFATFIERKTRLYTAIPMKDRTANSMQYAITKLYGILPVGAFKTGHVAEAKNLLMQIR